MKQKNSIKGIGTDIVEIPRVQQAIERHGQNFLNRIFTLHEQNYCLRYHNSYRHFAGKFAAKEAVVKALGTGFGAKISWHDVMIHNEPSGQPKVVLSDSAKKLFKTPNILITLSHSEKYATAFAIWLD